MPCSESAANIAVAAGVATDAWAKFTDPDEDLDQLLETMNAIGGSAAKFAAEIRGGKFVENAQREADARRQAAAFIRDQTQVQKELEQGSSRLLAIEQARALAAAQARDPLEGQRLELERQIESIRAMRLDEDNRIRANTLIKKLEQEQLDLLTRQQTATAGLASAEQNVRSAIAEIELFDPEEALRFGRALDAALTAGIGSEAQLEALLSLGREASETPRKDDYSKIPLPIPMKVEKAGFARVIGGHNRSFHGGILSIILMSVLP